MSLVLVTGACGNLGRSLVRRLIASGARVRAFDLPTRHNQRFLRSLGPRVDVALGDVTRDADVEEAVRGVSAIAHLAGVLPPSSERRPEITRAVNVEGTRRIVRAFERQRPDGRLVLASSFSVYGPSQAARGLATVDSPVEATDAYTSSKLAAEEILRGSSLDWTILRVAAAIEGSRGASDPIVVRLMFEIRPEQPIEIVHGDDVAIAFASALADPAAGRRIFLIGGGPSCQLRQRDLLALSLGVVGAADLPARACGRAPYYTCWMDTREAERVLRFQKHDAEAIRAALAARLGAVGALARVFGPLTRSVLLRLSGPYAGHPPRPTWKELIDAGY
jgi:UDP-glucose 4-epimerase